MSPSESQRPHEPDWYCPAKSKQTGEQCGRRAGAGTDHKGHGLCKHHGGASPGGVLQGQRMVAAAECVRLGLEVDTTPAEALLREVRETSGNVAFYRSLVAELPTHPTAPVRVEVEGGPQDGAVEWTEGIPGVYAPTFHQSGIPTGEAKPHVLVQLYNDERKHLVGVVSAALKANVDERRVRVEEQHGEELAAVVRAIVLGLGRRLDDPEVVSVVRGVLTAGDTVEGSVAA